MGGSFQSGILREKALCFSLPGKGEPCRAAESQLSRMSSVRRGGEPTPWLPWLLLLLAAGRREALAGLHSPGNRETLEEEVTKACNRSHFIKAVLVGSEGT